MFHICFDFLGLFRVYLGLVSGLLRVGSGLDYGLFGVYFGLVQGYLEFVPGRFGRFRVDLEFILGFFWNLFTVGSAFV